jgi:hypothetical protein
MIAKESQLSRKSIDRYFPDKPTCMIEVAKYIGETVWKSINEKYVNEMFTGGEYTGADLLKMYMEDIKGVFKQEPNIFVFYIEFKIYLARHSEDSEDFKRKYGELKKTIGCGLLAEAIYLLGSEDGSLRIALDVSAEAEYFCKSYFSFLSNMALMYEDQKDLALWQIDRYIRRIINLYKRD